MPSSDSEDFESADEGHSSIDKKERKKRLSSSNYSDNALETDQDPNDKPISVSNVKKLEKKEKQETDGWDDFDIDENEPATSQSVVSSGVSKEQDKPQIQPAPKPEQSQDTGWGDFGDWGQDSSSAIVQDQQPKPRSSQPDQDMKTVADRLAAVSTEPASSNWGWGWSVDSLISTASAGISTLTSQVSQGISTVLETGIGAPDPEELARTKAAKNEGQDAQCRSPDKPTKEVTESQESKGNVSEGQFPFGSLISGVTKFVETTGTKVISGGLDTLETIGKKTMEVLQDGDPGLAKKRALLGLDSGDKPVLSQVLREAKARADEEDNVREQKREAKEVHYENLFDDFEGLVHLEALEMLSRQVRLRIDERLRGAEPSKRQDINETLHQVAELCEMPEEEDDDEEPQDGSSKSDAFHERLQTATQDLGLKLQFQPLVKQHDDVSQWVSQSSGGARVVYKRAVGALAQTTALCMEVYHKAAEMLLVKPRRSTADEADALTQMTVVLTKHISELATLFTEKLNSLPDDDKDQINNYTTNIFLEAGNSSTYIQNAFQLILPILQIGAV